MGTEVEHTVPTHLPGARFAGLGAFYDMERDGRATVRSCGAERGHFRPNRERRKKREFRDVKQPARSG